MLNKPKTNRSQFIAWLKFELLRQGVPIPKSITYRELQSIISTSGIRPVEDDRHGAN